MASHSDGVASHGYGVASHGYGVASHGDGMASHGDGMAYRGLIRGRRAGTVRGVPLVRECRFTAIDFESAGAARGKTDTPVQVGMASWSVAGGHEGHFVSYLRTDQPVQWAARKVHGIGPEQLADAPSMLMLWPEFRNRLAGAVVIAHAKGTEKRFLGAFPGHGFGPWIDTLLLARAAWPDLPGHSLGAVCETLGLCETVRELVPGKAWHDALFDAAASLVLLSHLVEALSLQEKSLDSLLHPDTRVWHSSRRSN